MVSRLEPNDFTKNLCNDPKCPLNRQGMPHDTHDKIENQAIADPCNDPRCAMNRMGLPHNKHDDKYETKSESKNRPDAETEYGPWDVDSEDDAGQQYYTSSGLRVDKHDDRAKSWSGHTSNSAWTNSWIKDQRGYQASSETSRQGHGEGKKREDGTKSNMRSPTDAAWTGQWGKIPTPPKSQNDVPRHERMKAKQRDGRQESHEHEHESPLHQFEREQEPDQKHDAEDDVFEGTFDDALSELARQLHRGRSEKQSSATRQAEEMSPPPKRDPMLAATEPHDVFGIPKNATCRDIKSRYRALAREHDPSKGIINKSDGDKRLSNEIMTKINRAYAQLKEIHGC